MTLTEKQEAMRKRLQAQEVVTQWEKEHAEADAEYRSKRERRKVEKTERAARIEFIRKSLADGAEQSALVDKFGILSVNKALRKKTRRADYFAPYRKSA